jgi:glutamyl-tRNA reductase
MVATGSNPTVDKAILNLKKPLLILDLSIPKNVNQDVEEWRYINPYGLFVSVDR